MSKEVTPEQLQVEILKDLDALHRGICTELMETIVDNTPVQTGALKGSITVGVGSPDLSYTPGDLDPTGGATKMSNANKLKAATIKTPTYLNVNAPHANDVENGTAESPPVGFVRSAAESLGAIINRVSQNLKKWR